MNWKNRLTNYNFWISIFSAVLLILQALKIEFDIAYVNEIFTAVLGLLVVIGIISDPTRTSIKSADSTNKGITETKKDIEKTKSKQETTLPTIEENEVDNINSQNDIQAVLNKISTDLAQKMQEIRELNNQTYSYIQMQKQNEIQQKTISEQEIQEEKNQIEQGLPIEPAVAEMENPYFDLIK